MWQEALMIHFKMLHSFHPQEQNKTSGRSATSLWGFEPGTTSIVMYHCSVKPLGHFVTLLTYNDIGRMLQGLVTTNNH